MGFAPICKNCKMPVERDRSGAWVYMHRRHYGTNFSVEYPVYICQSQGDTLHGHEVDILGQFGIHDLYDIEKGLR